jgi:hypothetical protein
MLYDCQYQDRASLRFKRAQRVFVRDIHEAIELLAFVEAIGLHAAKHIFGWGYARVVAYKELRRNHLAEAQPYIRANEASMGVDDGVAVLQAMQAGGWRRGILPKVTRQAVRQMHHEGTSLTKIAAKLRVKRHALENALRTRKLQSASAYAALGIG